MAEALLGGSDDDKSVSRRQRELERHRQELAAVRIHLGKAYDDRLAGLIKVDYFALRARSWEAQIVYLQRCIAELESSQTPNNDDAALELGDVIRMFKESSDPVERRRLIEAVHSNCFWRAGELVVEWSNRPKT